MTEYIDIALSDLVFKCSDSYIKDVKPSKPLLDLILTRILEPYSEHNRTSTLTTSYGHNPLKFYKLSRSSCKDQF